MIVTKAFLRYLPRRRGLSLLQLMGIACGVAAAIGMALSAQVALLSFTQAVRFLQGKATHSLERPAGPLEETLLLPLMEDEAVLAFAPVIDRRLRLGTGDAFRLLGIDPFLDRVLRPDLAGFDFRRRSSHEMDEILSFFLDERAVLLDSRLAEELKIKPGESLASSRGELRVIGTFSNPSSEPLILMDIAHAQKLFGLSGKLDRVDLIVADDVSFLSRWSTGFKIQSGLQRQASLADMLRAFRLNLQALSLMALFVGVFLVYNTAMFSVISRRKEAGILRSLGTTRWEIILAFLSEILLLGALGGVLGGIGGYFLSSLLNSLMAGTISHLYFFLQPISPEWSWKVLLQSISLGLGASLLGSLFPLAELVRTDPVGALQGRVPGRAGKAKAQKAALAGLFTLGLSAVLLVFSSLHVYIGFASSFGLLFGASLFSGWILVLTAPAIRVFLKTLGGLAGRIAAGNLRQNLVRVGVAVAAFMVALAMTIGLGAMIESFRQSLCWWMETQLTGDVYIGKIGEAEIPEDFYQELRSIAGLGGVDIFRNVQILYQGTPIYVSAVDASVLEKFTRFGWLSGGNENWERVKKGEAIVSESFARRFGMKPGDRITLQGARGPASLKIAAAFYDYTSEHGVVMMDRSTYLRVFEDPTINVVAVFLKPGDPRRQQLLDEVRRRATERGLPVFFRGELYGNILSVFDSTFAVTRSMRLLTIIVAFFGIAGALLTLFMERQKEWGIYRSLGFSTGQVARMTLMEGLGMGMVSFLMSIPVGTILAFILTRVINLRSFNWTVFYHFSWEPYWLAAATAILASIGAALYPIWKVYRTYPQMQLREE